MYCCKCGLQVCDQVRHRNCRRLLRSSDQDIVPPGDTGLADDSLGHSTQSPFCPVSRNSVANFSGTCEPNANTKVFRFIRFAFSCLKNKTRHRLPGCPCSEQEISAFLDYRPRNANSRRTHGPGGFACHRYPRRCHSITSGCELRAKRLAAFGPTCIQNLASGFGGHTRPKTVAPLADQVRGLKCALHIRLLRRDQPKSQWIRRPCMFEARHLGRCFDHVNSQ
jgi:hypothetical protein